MKILFVLSRVPWPLEKGDKLRAFQLIRELSKQHDVLLFCLSDQNIHTKAETMLKSMCSEVYIHRFSRMDIVLNLTKGLFNRLPFQVNYFYSKKAADAFDRYLEKHLPQHIFCQLIRTAEYVRKYTLIPKSIDYMDALSSGMDRASQHTGWPVNIPMMWETKRLKEYEKDIQSDFLHRYIISEQDRNQLSYVEDLHVVPNGISEEFLVQKQVSAYKCDILFTGNMAYRPNVECAKFLAMRVMPLVWEKRPEATLYISGATPSKAVLALASDRVKVTGWIDDIAEMYRSSKVFAAPMSIGSGLQNKLLEAMACGVACITSNLANNALMAVDGESVLIANDAESVSVSILRLLENEELRSRIGEAGRAFVTSQYSWQKAASLLSF
ncbi:MAG: glycosyltransferase [Flavobacteriales bacterium]